MIRVLITGISGTGKSTVTAALAAHGYRAIDADLPAFSHWARRHCFPRTWDRLGNRIATALA